MSSHSGLARINGGEGVVACRLLGTVSGNGFRLPTFGFGEQQRQ